MRVRAARLLIVIGLTACDNVQWGGADLVIVPPPPHVSDDGPIEERTGVERLPEGPVLYHVRVQGGSAALVPIAEIAGDSLRPIRAASDWAEFGERFIAEHLREGSEFTLYRNGARAGTFVVQSAGLPAAADCAPIPVASGVLELTAAAAAYPEFLAMARVHAPPAGYEPPIPLAPDQRARIMAPILAEQIIRARGAMLPNDWQRATAQIHPFPTEPGGQPGIAATFLVGDSLGIGLDDQGQSTFFVALPSGTGYDTVYVRFADYPSAGKSAPRVVDFFDWNRDGQAGLILEVYGTTGSWYEAVGPANGRWGNVFTSRCSQPAAASQQDAAGPVSSPTPTPAEAAPPAAPGPTPQTSIPDAVDTANDGESPAPAAPVQSGDSISTP
ncbi:MAG TPA: hypothetical protein VNZ57_14130 [Longimicrobiales bacterium]|nr:hypothetical protein [Longimicrobiales bacterium]